MLKQDLKRMEKQFSPRMGKSKNGRRWLAACLALSFSAACGNQLSAQVVTEANGDAVQSYLPAQAPQPPMVELPPSVDAIPNSGEVPPTGVPTATEGNLPAEVAQEDLELPSRPPRAVPNTEATRPVASQANRDQHRGTKQVLTQAYRQPIPANPGRNLPLPGEMQETSEAMEEAEIAPGLFEALPHQWNGITVEYIYTGEVFSNARGGLDTNQATKYRGNFDLVFIFDSEAMGLWEGGQFFLYGQNTHGQALSTDYVGDFQLISNIDSAPFGGLSQFSEYWYRHSWLDDALIMKAGKQDANADFAFIDLGGDFIHSSFGMIPTVPLPTFPAPSLGLASFAKVTEQLEVGGGVYDGGGQGNMWGFNTFGHEGFLSLVQFTYRTQTGPYDQHPGSYRFGMWYHSNDRDAITDGDAFTYDSNHGFWGSADQMIWKECYGTDDTQGLSIFFQYGWAPKERNEGAEYYGAGAVYQGLLAGRDNDLTGVGVANLFYSPLLRGIDGRTQETAIELYHKFRISPYFSLQPDLQMVCNPGGEGRDALVPGGRFEIVF